MLQRVTERVLVGLGPVPGARPLRTSTVVAGAEATMVVDTMSSAVRVEPVRAAAVELGSRPVAWVLNTHGDRDHLGGNGAFEGARVAAHRSVAEHGLTRVDEPFDEAWETDLGGLLVQVSYVGPAHSEGDSFAWLPDEGVAALGSLPPPAARAHARRARPRTGGGRPHRPAAARSPRGRLRGGEEPLHGGRAGPRGDRGRAAGAVRHAAPGRRPLAGRGEG